MTSRKPVPTAGPSNVGDGAALDRRWHLADRRDFLIRSLADLQAERDAGDIGERHYEALRRRDEEQLAALDAELAAFAASSALLVEPTPRDAGLVDDGQRAEAPNSDELTSDPPRGPRRRRRLWLVVVGVVALSAATTLLVVHLASPRLPGAPETGSAAQNLAQKIQTQLAQATVLVDEGTATSLSQALSLYRSVLAEDPNQPQALAETGWLEWEAGYTQGNAALEDTGRALVKHSLRVKSNDFGAHLFLGTIKLEQDHDAVAAVAQFRLFLAEHPPKDRITSAAAILNQAFQEAGEPLPAGVPTS